MIIIDSDFVVTSETFSLMERQIPIVEHSKLSVCLSFVLIFNLYISDFTMRNAIWGVRNGTIFVRFYIFTMRKLIFCF